MYIKEALKITETRAEDEIFYQGPFWVKGNSIIDIKLGNYEIEANKVPCNYAGNILKGENKVHSQIKPDDYSYYPRGRVGIYNGKAFINIHSILNQPDIIDDIVNIFNLSKLDVQIKHEDSKEGHHYNFDLD